jgi:hypothetical protein
MPKLTPLPPITLHLNKTMADLFERDIILFTRICELIDTGLLPVHYVPGPGPHRVPIPMLTRPEVEKIPGVRVDDDDRICRVEQEQSSLEPCADELAGDSPELVTVVEKRLNAGHRPGKGGNEQWERFCDQVRKDCGKKATDRGYGDRTIKRIVKLLKDK